MKVKLLRAIPHHQAGDIVEMTEDQAKAYGKGYVEPVKTNKKEEEEKKNESETDAKTEKNEPESKNKEETDGKTEDIGDVAQNTAILSTNQTK